MTTAPAPATTVPAPEGARRLAQELVDRGIAAEISGTRAKALQHYRQAIEADPLFAPAHMNLGIALQAEGDLGAAIASHQRAIALDPGHAAANYNLALAHLEAGEAGQAEAAFRSALQIRSEFPEAWVGLADALQTLDRDTEALAALNTAIAQRDDYIGARLNAGVLLQKMQRLSEAEAGYRHALEMKPDDPMVHNNLGIALQAFGRWSEAAASFRRALELEPDYHEAHSNLVFALDFLESCGTREHQEQRSRWYAQHGLRYAGAIQPHDNLPDSGRRLRIGYVSADFRRHSACYVFGPVLQCHDRAAFEVVCYSGVRHEDEITQGLRGAVDEWRTTLRMSDEALAERIRRDRIDILVDLSGHTEGSRLLVFARKPAPVQVTAWGHATGTGVKTIDYLFSDPVLVPQEERSLFAEEVIDLPCSLCYAPPQYLPEVSGLPALGGTPLTFGCINRAEKISDRAIAAWSRILGEVPSSQLLVKHVGLRDPWVREHLLKRLHAVGIGAERVRLIGFTPHAEHLKVYHEVDLGLDPFPQNGGVSTAEALWMGVPVVALNGTTLSGRIAASMLTALDMQDWIAGSDEEYVRIAVEAARDLPRLARTRAFLRPRLAASDFGDVQRYTRAVEAAYRQMWRRWCAG